MTTTTALGARLAELQRVAAELANAMAAAADAMEAIDSALALGDLA
jgi:hypothetical protein